MYDERDTSLVGALFLPAVVDHDAALRHDRVLSTLGFDSVPAWLVELYAYGDATGSEAAVDLQEARWHTTDVANNLVELVVTRYAYGAPPCIANCTNSRGVVESVRAVAAHTAYEQSEAAAVATYMARAIRTAPRHGRHVHRVDPVDAEYARRSADVLAVPYTAPSSPATPLRPLHPKATRGRLLDLGLAIAARRIRRAMQQECPGSAARPYAQAPFLLHTCVLAEVAAAGPYAKWTTARVAYVEAWNEAFRRIREAARISTPLLETEES